MGNKIFRWAVVALLLTISACSGDGVAADQTAKGKDAKSDAATLNAEIVAKVGAKTARAFYRQVE